MSPHLETKLKTWVTKGADKNFWGYFNLSEIKEIAENNEWNWTESRINRTWKRYRKSTFVHLKRVI